MKLNSTHKLTVVGKVSAKEAGKVALIMVYTKLFLAIVFGVCLIITTLNITRSSSSPTWLSSFRPEQKSTECTFDTTFNELSDN